MALADTSGEQSQANQTDQGNSSSTSATQANPAINAQDVLGLGELATGAERSPSIEQDNSVDNTTKQGNENSTEQSWTSDRTVLG